jgi:hypothetical protein
MYKLKTPARKAALQAGGLRHHRYHRRPRGQIALPPRRRPVKFRRFPANNEPGRFWPGGVRLGYNGLPL